MPFSTAGTNCRGMEPPKMSSTNSKSEPRGSGSIVILQSPNWPWPPVCFLWRPCASTRRRDRLAIGDARRLQRDFDAEPPAQFGDRHFDVQLALAGQQQFVRLRIAGVADRRVLFVQALHRRADLVLVVPALRLDRIGQHRFRERDGRHRKAGGLVAEDVVRVRVLEFRDRAEVARVEFRHVRLRLALQHEHVADAFGQIARTGCARSCPP